MKQIRKIGLMAMLIVTGSSSLYAQKMETAQGSLNPHQRSIITISSFTATGNLQQLKPALHSGLDAGLTVNEIREALVHLYAYCGFPRSIRGLQTFMEVLDERKSKGITDPVGKEASPVKDEGTKYERGKKTLGELTKMPQPDKLTGYGAFAPVMDTFLKEHLFADIFERDVLSYAQRELVTIAVIASIGQADPMLQSHMGITMNTGISPDQLKEFVTIIKSTAGKKEAAAAQKVLDKVLNNN